MSDPTAYAYFGIKGDFDPLDASRTIPVSPDECIAKHSRNPEHKVPRISILRYAEVSTHDRLIDVYVLAEKVVEKLEPHQEALRRMIDTHGVDALLEVVLHLPVSKDVSLPILGFSQRVVRFLAATGASIDIDCYRG